MDLDEQWMARAIAAAHEAEDLGEIPVGACVVSEDKLLAVAGNRTRTDGDPTAHAEVLALRIAAQVQGNYRLINAVVYSTIEPCAMCAGALIQARVRTPCLWSPGCTRGCCRIPVSDLRFGVFESPDGIDNWSARGRVPQTDAGLFSHAQI